MKVYLAQINPIIGDLEGNQRIILSELEKAKGEKADLIIFPEMAITGYPPQDLLLRSYFIDKAWKMVEEIGAKTDDIYLLMGLPRRNPSQVGKRLFNSCAVFGNKHFVGFYDKILLPTYDVFDERRYFEPGTFPFLLELKGKRIAITICEDIWQHSGLLEDQYSVDPVEDFKRLKPDLLVNLSASPYFIGKGELRQAVAIPAALTLSCPVILVNQVGANDTLIFDGHSFMLNGSGEIVVELPSFKEASSLIDLDKPQRKIREKISREEELLSALILGLKDFTQKLGFKKVLLGLSGGIDSALVASIAALALGNNNVIGVLLSSKYTSKESVEDAKLLADAIGIETLEIPIRETNETLLQTLKPHFHQLPEDITEENIQSRLRGIILMALSNKFRALLLNTGNKSEYSVGFATLYGDMCGALSVIGDLTKKEVYNLSKFLHIPQGIIDKIPTAELRPNQKDSDTLPPYSTLDLIVSGYIEENLSPEEIASMHHLPPDLVKEWTHRIDLADFKRYQAPPILKVTKKSLSFGRHFPIVKKL